MYVAGTLGVFAGFLLAYQQSTGWAFAPSLPSEIFLREMTFVALLS